MYRPWRITNTAPAPFQINYLRLILSFIENSFYSLTAPNVNRLLVSRSDLLLVGYSLHDIPQLRPLRPFDFTTHLVIDVLPQDRRPQLPTKVGLRLNRPLKSIIFDRFIFPEPHVSVDDHALKERMPILPLHQIPFRRIPPPQHLPNLLQTVIVHI
jgi:hypothetical protein